MLAHRCSAKGWHLLRARCMQLLHKKLQKQETADKEMNHKVKLCSSYLATDSSVVRQFVGNTCKAVPSAAVNSSRYKPTQPKQSACNEGTACLLSKDASLLRGLHSRGRMPRATWCNETPRVLLALIAYCFRAVACMSQGDGASIFM